MLLTVKKLGDTLGIPPSTVRTWVKEFAISGAFSATAVPGAGITRLFNADDIEVFQSIQAYRMMGYSSSRINEALERGERMLPPPMPGQESQQNEKQDTQAAAPLDAFTTALKAYESRLVAYDVQILETREKLLTAVERAAKAEGENALLKQMLETERAKTWWQKLRGK